MSTAVFRVELRVLPATRRSGWADRRTHHTNVSDISTFPTNKHSRHVQLVTVCVTMFGASVCHPHGRRFDHHAYLHGG
jgi:hypothetical protein